MDQNTPLVPRNVYTQAVLSELNTVPYDPAHHNGMRNPYSHQRIASQADYEEYVREYVYYRLCDELIAKKYAEQLAQNTRQLESRQRIAISQLNAQHQKDLSRARWRWPILVVLLLMALCYTFFCFIPGKEATARQNGETSGYKSGYDAGLQEGKKANESRSSSSSSSASNSTSDTSTARVTEPKSWVSLDRTVYVSRNNKIHLSSSCSNMQYFTEMTYGEACDAGCLHCQHCF